MCAAQMSALVTGRQFVSGEPLHGWVAVAHHRRRRTFFCRVEPQIQGVQVKQRQKEVGQVVGRKRVCRRRWRACGRPSWGDCTSLAHAKTVGGVDGCVWPRSFAPAEEESGRWNWRRFFRVCGGCGWEQMSAQSRFTQGTILPKVEYYVCTAMDAVDVAVHVE